MSEHYADGRHWDEKVQGWELDDDPYEDALLSREDLKARIAELEAERAKYKWLAEHDIRLVPKDDWHTPGEPDQLGGFAVERRMGFVLTRLQRRWEARQL